MLPKWKDTDLLIMQDDGYKICPCKDEDEALEVKKVLKENTKCAQAGYILDKEGNKKYFVITRDRVKKGN